MHPHHHHHGGHIPHSAFSNWGGWAWPEPSVQYFVIEDEGVPDWVWIAGGVLAGAVLALLSRGR